MAVTSAGRVIMAGSEVDQVGTPMVIRLYYSTNEEWVTVEEYGAAEPPDPNGITTTRDGTIHIVGGYLGNWWMRSSADEGESWDDTDTVSPLARLPFRGSSRGGVGHGAVGRWGD